MASHVEFVGTLTIPNGTKPSNVLVVNLTRLATRWIFVTPAAFTGTVSVEGNHDGSTTTLPLKADGTDVTLTAGRVHSWWYPGLKAIRVNSGSNEGADRIVQVYAEVEAAD